MAGDAAAPVADARDHGPVRLLGYESLYRRDEQTGLTGCVVRRDQRCHSSVHLMGPVAVVVMVVMMLLPVSGGEVIFFRPCHRGLLLAGGMRAVCLGSLVVIWNFPLRKRVLQREFIFSPFLSSSPPSLLEPNSKRTPARTTTRTRLTPTASRRRSALSTFRPEAWIPSSCETKSSPRSTTSPSGLSSK